MKKRVVTKLPRVEKISEPGRQRIRRRILRCLISGILLTVASTAVFGLCWWLLPFDARRLVEYPAGRRILDRDGRWLRVYAASSGEMRFPVALDDMSPWLRKATVAVEDQRFFSHRGVDGFAALRALSQNVWRGEIHSGASTLTMQLVRILDQRPRTFVSKVVEALHALQITAQISKNETLEAYLNLAPYGGNLRGVEAASRRYFGKSARLLSLSEAALLVGLPQSPSRLRPDRYYARAIRRRATVLRAMLSLGSIDEARYREVLAMRPEVRRHAWPFSAPHFGDLVRRESAGRDANRLEVGGDEVRSTLDQRAQKVSQERLASFLRAKRSRERLSGAVVVIDVESREVRAFVGSVDYFDDRRAGQVSCAEAPRASGSTLKPFLYALAYDAGLAGPSTYLADVPTSYKDFNPENYDRLYRGPVPASRALAASLNLPAARLQARVGVERLRDTLVELGLDSPDRRGEYGVTLSLGAHDVKLIDLVNAYVTLLQGGLHASYRTGHPSGQQTIASFDKSGRPQAGRLQAGESRVFSAAASFLVLRDLSTEEHLSRVAGVNPQETESTIGYKTGTSWKLRDAWCVAWNGRWVVGVWLGDPRGKPHTDLIGLEAAAPIALGIVRDLGAGTSPSSSSPSRARPHDLITRLTCTLTGYPLGDDCPTSRSADFPGAGKRLPRCRVHRRIWLAPGGERELCPMCRSGQGTETVVTRWPLHIARWMETRGVASSRRRVQPCDCRVRVCEPPEILSPTDGASYLYLENAPFTQSLRLLAAQALSGDALHWFVDGEYYPANREAGDLTWQLKPGEHEIRCVDGAGRADVSKIRVRAAKNTK